MIEELNRVVIDYCGDHEERRLSQREVETIEALLLAYQECPCRKHERELAEELFKIGLYSLHLSLNQKLVPEIRVKRCSWRDAAKAKAWLQENKLEHLLHPSGSRLSAKAVRDHMRLGGYDLPTNLFNIICDFYIK